MSWRPRKAPIHPSTADLGKWRKLCRLAKAAASSPAAPVGDLERAVRSAYGALQPVHLRHHKSSTWLFIRCAEAFVQTEPDERRRHAGQLASLADEASAALGFDKPAPAAGDEPPERPPTRRYRADIDG